jgi:hypothetical protein
MRQSAWLTKAISDLQSRETPQRKGVRVLRLSKTAITLQSLNVNYPVLPRSLECRPCSVSSSIDVFRWVRVQPEEPSFVPPLQTRSSARAQSSPGNCPVRCDGTRLVRRIPEG